MMMPKLETPTTALYWRALHMKVLVIAVVNVLDKKNETGDWSAYTTPVPGVSHEDELYLWRVEGEKTDHALAAHLFPYIEEDERFVWRD